MKYRFKVTLLIAASIFLAYTMGCNLTPLMNEDELDEALYYEQVVWDLCLKVYSKAHTPTMHIGHTHMKPMSKRQYYNAMRDDNWTNNCYRYYDIAVRRSKSR